MVTVSSSVHLERCEHGLTYPPTFNWPSRSPDPVMKLFKGNSTCEKQVFWQK